MEAVEEQKTTFEPSKDEIEIDTTEAQETEVELGKEADDKEAAVEVEEGENDDAETTDCAEQAPKIRYEVHATVDSSIYRFLVQSHLNHDSVLG